jgi:hypothetical protein
MVLPALDALTLTNSSLIKNSTTDLQTEVGLAETRIRTAAGLGLYALVYNATIIGNPAVDPRTTNDLPPNQLNFYNAFAESGYIVGLETATGYWSLAWASQGAEHLVTIYSFRTSYNPASIVNQTITTIMTFFEAQIPIVHVNVDYNGFIDQTSFGGVSSTYYEFTIVADQETDTHNFSSTLKTYITTQSFGYTDSNCNVYQMVV